MRFWQVDSFTGEIFKGNPAAVFLIETELPDRLMLSIAMEMNLSESAFVCLGTQPTIRWFTPASEVNLCGHATLAAAHVLWEQGLVNGDSIELSSKSGPLGVTRTGSSYCLNFPVQAATPAAESTELVQAILEITPEFVGSNGEDCMAIVGIDSLVREFVPPLDLISKLAERGFILSARDTSGEYDYIYRAFFPKLNIAEDPVTGSANTCLAPYWSERLQSNKLKAFQASARGGELELTLADKRVLISGQAITVIEGVFKV